jgi:hypothetical protein
VGVQQKRYLVSMIVTVHPDLHDRSVHISLLCSWRRRKAVIEMVSGFSGAPSIKIFSFWTIQRDSERLAERGVAFDLRPSELD